MLSKIKDNKKVFIFDDLNVRIGREENDLVIVKYGESVMNENGLNLFK